MVHVGLGADVPVATAFVHASAVPDFVEVQRFCFPDACCECEADRRSGQHGNILHSKSKRLLRLIPMENRTPVHDVGQGEVGELDVVGVQRNERPLERGYVLSLRRHTRHHCPMRDLHALFVASSQLFWCHVTTLTHYINSQGH